MKRATGKFRAHRSLTLAARRAARAFCRRDPKPTLACRATVWTPALLRWARKRSGGARASASHRYSASTVAWTSYFHLHFVLAAPFRVSGASGRAHADGAAKGLQMPRSSLKFFLRGGDRTARSLAEPLRGAQAQSAVEARNEPTRWQRHHAEGFGTGLPAAMRYAAGIGRIVERSAAAVHTPLHSPRRLHLIVQQQLARSISAAQSTRLFARAHTRSPPLSRASAAQSSQQVTRASSLNSALRPARDTTQIRRPIQHIWRTRNAETAVVHASPHPQALAMKRAVDLVWRSNTTVAAATVDNPQRSATTATLSASDARSKPAAALTLPSRTVDKTVVHANVLDPLLADRLADDVIRRIDRRARIERERWGH